MVNSGHGIANTARGSSPTYVVHLSILGIAGIVVDRSHSKNVGTKKEVPKPPKKMKAVVAVSRGSHVKGTSTLSRPLSRSPGGDVILSGEGQNGDRKAGDVATGQRHIAIWASDDNVSLGSTISFETTFNCLDVGDSYQSTTTTIPKSFDLTVALAENSDHERKVALPIGLATLNVSGEQNEAVVLDLPVLNLKQARPTVSNDNGLQGFQMLSIYEQTIEATKKKRNMFGRVLRRKDSTKEQKIPSIPERRRFSSTYSVDSNGDAIVRVKMQIVPKGVHHVPEESADPIIQMGPAEEILGEQPLESHEASEYDDDQSSFSTLSVISSSIRTSSFTKGSTDTATTRSSHGTTRSEGTKMSSPDCEETLSEGGTHTVEMDSRCSSMLDHDEEGAPKSSNIFADMLPDLTCGRMIHPDDMTHVTGDFFGRDVPIPVCGAVKRHLDDGDTLGDTIGDTIGEALEDEEAQGFRRNEVLRSFFGPANSAKIQENANEVLARAQAALKKDELLGRSIGGSLLNRSIREDEPASKQEDQSGKRDAGSPIQSRNSSGLKKPTSVADSLAAYFQCSMPSTVDDTAEEYSPRASMQVPNDLEIPDDFKSMEDLTASTTYVSVVQKAPKRRTPAREGVFPLPVALGGGGMCTNFHLVEESELVESEAPSRDDDYTSYDIVSEGPTVKDNYFEDYDNCSIERPRSRLSVSTKRRVVT